jgi:hypothetical protein
VTALIPDVTRRQAIVAAIKADVVLFGMLAKGTAPRNQGVYLRRRPADDAPLPCIVLGPVSQHGDNRYHEPGHLGLEAPEPWGTTLWEAEDIWVELYRVLHLARLPLDGHRMMRGELERLTDLADPVEGAHKIVTRYRVLSRRA